VKRVPWQIQVQPTSGRGLLVLWEQHVPHASSVHCTSGDCVSLPFLVLIASNMSWVTPRCCAIAVGFSHCSSSVGCVPPATPRLLDNPGWSELAAVEMAGVRVSFDSRRPDRYELRDDGAMPVAVPKLSNFNEPSWSRLKAFGVASYLEPRLFRLENPRWSWLGARGERRDSWDAAIWRPNAGMS
jgi:hypothetical protein